MKKNNFKMMTLIIVSFLFLSSCKKEGVTDFIGEYTYNTSGNVIVNIGGVANPVGLFNRTGQMEILDIGEKDRVMVVKRSLSGDITSMYATIDGDQISIEPETHTKTVNILLEAGTVTFTCTASGNIFDHNNIILNEVYDGTFAGQGSLLNVAGTVYSDDILTVAKRNDD